MKAHANILIYQFHNAFLINLDLYFTKLLKNFKGEKYGNYDI